MTEQTEGSIIITGHSGYVNSCNFSQDDTKIVSGSSDNTIILWETNTQKQLHIFTGHTKSISSCNFSPCGKYIVSGSWDKTIRVWEITGKLLYILKWTYTFCNLL